MRIYTILFVVCRLVWLCQPVRITSLDDSNFEEFISQNELVAISVCREMHPDCPKIQKAWEDFVEKEQKREFPKSKWVFGRLDIFLSPLTIQKYKLEKMHNEMITIKNGDIGRMMKEQSIDNFGKFLKLQYKYRGTEIMTSVREMRRRIRTGKLIVFYIGEHDANEADYFRQYARNHILELRERGAEFYELNCSRCLFALGITEDGLNDPNPKLRGIQLVEGEEEWFAIDSPGLIPDEIERFMQATQVIPKFYGEQEMSMEFIEKCINLRLYPMILMTYKGAFYNQDILDSMRKLYETKRDSKVWIRDHVYGYVYKDSPTYLSLQSKYNIQKNREVPRMIIAGSYDRLMMSPPDAEIDDFEFLSGFTYHNMIHQYMYYASEDIPIQHEDHVHQLVSDTFPSVYTNERDVFVLFYVPYCRFCKRFIPIWEELSVLYQDNHSLLIAQQNSEKNAYPSVGPFPMAIYYKKGAPYLSKGTIYPMPVLEKRTLDSLIEFIDFHKT